MKNSKQVSSLLGISERQVRKHAENIGMEKVGRDYIFTDLDILRIRSRLGKVGRPSQKSK